MPSVKVAHLHQQGQDMIIVPLDSSFGHRSSSDQHDAIDELQMVARGARLRGRVVPVWNDGGNMEFIAPRPWHPFFRSLDINIVYQNLNRELRW